MKRCPECKRDYYDDTLLYCLDDGVQLLEGPASMDEPQTAILPNAGITDESPTRTLDPAEAEATKPYVDKPGRSALETASRKATIIAGVVGVLLVSALGFGGYWFYGRGPSKQIESIAVMPFVNESGDKDLEYLADGMTDSLITSLSALPDLSVKASSSVFRYKGKDADASKLGTDLSVEAVLLGRLTKNNEELTLRLEVVNTRSETVLWSDSFTRGLDGLATLQKEIAQDVARQLRKKLSTREEKEVTSSYADNSESQRHYLLGRFHLAKRDIREFEQAITEFEKAIEVEPGNALAYSGLADAYGLTPIYNRSADPKVYISRARTAVLKAIELDDQLPEAYASLARIQSFYERDFPAAESSFRRSIELDPDYANARIWYSQHLSVLGRHEEAMEQVREALESEPLSLPVNRVAGGCFAFAGQLETAEKQYRKAIGLYPNDSAARRNLAAILAAQGRPADAAALAMEAIRLSEHDPGWLGKFEKAYKDQGWKGVVSVQLEFDLEQKRSRPFYRSYVIAVDYAEIGDLNKTLEYLERAAKERDINLNFVRIDVMFNGVRGDPRFEKLIREIGFPD